MDVKTIFCNIQLFDLYQRIMAINENGTSQTVAVSTVDALPEYLGMTAQKFNCNNIKLSGDTATASLVKMNLESLFSHLEIEVI